MKKTMLILIALMATLATLAGSAGAASAPTIFYYDDITLPPGGGFYWQPGTWDLKACPVTVSYTLDLSGAPNVAYTGNYGQSGYVGLVWPGSPWAGAWMSGFLCDWDNSGIEFPTYPDIDNSQDLDDKFNMQRSPYSIPWDETLYDVYCDTNTVAASPFGSGSNYGIWFDRDGVDPWQANMWGMVKGGTYNTSGVYDVQITYDRSANYPTSKGTACATFFPTLQNDNAPGGYGIPTGFNRIPKTDPNYPGYYDFPAGISFDTDETKMTRMQVFVSGNPGNGTIVVRDLTVTGCLATIEVEIDIKPGSDPNSINPNSKGVVPVAVLTTEDFDASTVDPATVEFADASPLRWTMEDVDRDDDMDLLFHFKTQELNLTKDSTEATLTGETWVGQPIEGTDTVNIVPKGK